MIVSLRLLAAEALMRLGCRLTPDTEDGLILLTLTSQRIADELERRIKR